MRGKNSLLVALLAVLVLAGLTLVLLIPQGKVAGVADSASLGLLLLDQADGVYILAVSDGSAADHAGLQPGDCILHVAQTPLEDVASFNGYLTQQGQTLPLTIRRNGREMHLSLPLR
ncbi:MAG: PDZ domain-containing protein [Clostridia bacterium]|nr:PDZ domain-containing protein [Clostridia bacterium]